MSPAYRFFPLFFNKPPLSQVKNPRFQLEGEIGAGYSRRTCRACREGRADYPQG